MARWLVPLMVCFGFAGSCSVGPDPGVGEGDLAARSMYEHLRASFSAQRLEAPSDAAQLARWHEFDAVVVLGSDPEAPLGELDEARRAALRGYVENGGRLLLLGFAARLAHDLGFESVAPDRLQLESWGDDERTAIGVYQYGLWSVDDPARLTPGMRAFPRHPRAFLFGGGGQGVIAQRCAWDVRAPRDGVILGRACELRDDVFRELDEVAAVRWLPGAGEVLAIGRVPEPWRSEPALAANARLLLDNAIRSLCAHRPTPRIGLCLNLPESRHSVSTAAPRYVLPRLPSRTLPGTPLLAHWGWQVATNYQRPGGAPIAPRAVYDDVLLPSFRAGAALLDLQLADPREGYPFAWSSDDPIARPIGWRGRAFWPGWSTEQVALLAREAHFRGMRLQCWLDPAPLALAGETGGAAGDRDALAAARWLARELADVRSLGAGAVDGFGVGSAWTTNGRDPAGLFASMLRSYHPAAFGYQTRPRTHGLNGFVGVVDADRGRPAGLPTAGLSAVWRDVFGPSEFVGGVLDARERAPSLVAAATDLEGERGGGSYPDWLVTQLHDFVRPRIGKGAAVWWRAHNDATLGAETIDYVHGLSVDPLRAAVAGRLTATGVGGFRELCAEAIGARAQSGFGAESPLPAATPFLQNNHLRLHGSGGPLWFDPSGTALFRAQHASTLEVAPTCFMSTHVRGFRPTIEGAGSGVIDLIGPRSRGAGGYGASVEIRGAERGNIAFPATLARDAAPEWPAAVSASFHAARGRYELDLALVGADERGIVELRVDGEVLGLFAHEVASGAVRHRVEVPLARDGMHELALTLVFGRGAVGVPICRLHRLADHAGQSHVGERAGHLAELVETSSSSYYGERLSWRAIADFPGLVVASHCDVAARNVQVVRRFELPFHRTLRLAQEPATALTQPFVLASNDPRVPDLAVLPLTVPFAFRFTLENGGLELVTYPRVHQEFAVGFVLLRDHRSDDLPALLAACRSIAEPSVVRLEVDGEAATDPVVELAPLGARTTIPRLVRVVDPRRGPLFVREAGAWAFRGVQAARGPLAAEPSDAAQVRDGLGASAGRDGSAWLRVFEVPGHPVAITSFDPARNDVRPGPGSLHSVVLRDVTAASVAVEVHSVGPFDAAPSVVFRERFDRVTLDGEPWAYVDGATVYLPAEPGVYRVEVGELGRAVEPRLLASRAIVKRCRYDATLRELELFTVARPDDFDADRAPMYTFWIDGDAPSEIVGERAVRIPEDTFSHRDTIVEASTRGPRRGFIVRCAPGLLRLRYP